MSIYCLQCLSVSQLIVAPIVGFCNCSFFVVRYIVSNTSFAIILMGKRELVGLLSLSSWCLVFVVRLFLPVPQVCLQFVIVVFPDHTHYFRKSISRCYIFKDLFFYFYVKTPAK